MGLDRMAALNAIASTGCSGGYANVCITHDLSTLTFIGWPPSRVDIGVAGTGYALARANPVPHPRMIGGHGSLSYADDYYDRIHLLPARIDLGNLVSTQVRQVQVWNAWRTQSRTLTELDAANAGDITVTSPGALPLTFAPLQLRSWQLSIANEGQPAIDATLTWLFSGEPPLDVIVTANRITAWVYPPDWSDNISESLAWLTDVQPALAGTEVRQPCRDAPRRQWEFNVIAYGVDRQRMENMLFDWTARTWAMPLFAEVNFLDAALPAGSSTIALDTSYLDFVAGGLAILWADTASYEVVQVADVAPGSITLALPTGNSWPAGTRLYPCRLAALTDAPSIPRKSDRLIQGQVRFESRDACDWPAIAPATTYLGYPVLDRSDEPGDMDMSYPRIVEMLDDDLGVPVPVDSSNLPYPTQQHAWMLYGRAERAAQRSLLYWLQGRAQALWVPSWSDDLEWLGTLASTGTVLTIVNVGVARFLRQQPGRRHIRIELNDGTVFFRRITGSTEIDAGTEQLSIDSALGLAVTPGDVRQTNWMMLARLAADEVQIAHVTDSQGIATSAANFVGVPGEEPA